MVTEKVPTIPLLKKEWIMPNKSSSTNKKKPKLKLIRDGSLEGFTISSIKEVMSEEGFATFAKWISGQTMGVYKDELVVYPVDLERFIKGLKPLD